MVTRSRGTPEQRSAALFIPTRSPLKDWDGIPLPLREGRRGGGQCEAEGLAAQGGPGRCVLQRSETALQMNQRRVTSANPMTQRDAKH